MTWNVFPVIVGYRVVSYYVSQGYDKARGADGNELSFPEQEEARAYADQLNQGETMSDYPFYDPNSMLAKRRKMLGRQAALDQLIEESSFSKKATEPEFKARPAVEKLKPKLLKEKITNDLNTVLALALEGLDNMNKDGVDDVYNVSKIRDLIVKVNREVKEDN